MAFVEITESEPTERFVESISPVKSRTHALVKGVVKGAEDIGRLSPVRGPISPEASTRLLNRFLPSENEPIERFTERISRGLTAGAIGGPEAALLSGGGEALAQAAQEAGAPDWAQHLASLIPFLKGKGGLSPTKGQKEAVEFLRAKGLTDKEITPLLKSEKVLERLAKYAHKGARVQKPLKGAHEKLGAGFGELKEAGKTMYMPREKVTPFVEDLDKTYDKLTPDFKKLVTQNIEDLKSNPLSARSLIDFWQDINNKMRKASREGIKGGREVLGILKEPVGKALKEINPLAAKEFQQLNEFYAKNQRALATLKPKQMDHLIDIAEDLGALGSLVTGNLNYLQKFLGIAAGRILATELIINPKLQNITNRMGQALAKNQIGIYQKLLSKFQEELENSNPELYKSISDKLINKKSQMQQERK